MDENNVTLVNRMRHALDELAKVPKVELHGGGVKAVWTLFGAEKPLPPQDDIPAPIEDKLFVPMNLQAVLQEIESALRV